MGFLIPGDVYEQAVVKTVAGVFGDFGGATPDTGQAGSHSRRIAGRMPA
jgi:hypothetical protein